MRKVTIDLVMSLSVLCEESVDISSFIGDGLDYNFKSLDDNVDIEDVSIAEYEIIDSR